MISPVKQGRWSIRVHMVVPGLDEIRVDVKETIVGTCGRQERSRHLRVGSGSKIPVVSSFCPSAICGWAPCTVILRVLHGQAQKLGSSTGCVIPKDGEGRDGESRIADTIPVAVDIVPPPANYPGILAICLDSEVQAILDDGFAELGFLLC